MIQKFVFAASFILSFFFNLSLLKGQNEYSAAHYDFTELLTENQGYNINRDSFGFYWIITNGGQVLRWNGNNFNTVTVNSKTKTSKETIFWRCNSDYKGTIYFPDKNSNYVYSIDRNGQLSAIDTAIVSRAFSFSVYGDFISLKEMWHDIELKNKPSIVNYLKSVITEDKGYTFGYSTSRDEFYLISINSILYCRGGKIFILPLEDIEAKKTALKLGEYLVIMWDINYRVYFRGKLVKSGVDYRLGKININNITIKRSFVAKNFSYILDKGNTIYKVKFEGGAFAISEYIVLPVKEIASNSFYVDETTGSILILDVSGGLSVFDKKHFYTKILSSKIAFNISYTLLHDGNNLFTNQDFQHKVIPDYNDYNTIAPFAKLPDGGYFYPSSTGAFILFNHKLKELKRWSSVFVNSSTKSLVTYNTKFIVAVNGILPYYDYLRKKLDTLNLKPALTLKERVKYITMGKEGVLYAVIDSSLYSITIDNGLRQEIRKGLPYAGDVRSLTYSAEYNGLFFTINNRGLFFFSLKSKRVLALPIDSYPHLKSCHYVLRDGDGDFWLPTNNGLYFMQKRRFEDFLNGHNAIINYYRFGKEQGILNPEFNGGFSTSGLSFGDSIYLSSMSGVVCFSPSEVKKLLRSNYSGKIFIAGINADDSTMVINRLVKLRPDFKRCIIKYDFPYVNVPGAVLEYQLSGFGDSLWIPLPENKEVMLRSLKPGRYQLRVRVQNKYDIAEAVIQIEVQQYWYLTVWAFLCYVIFSFLILVMVINWRISLVRNRSLQEIDKSRRELFSIISHDLRTPLKTYQGMADVVSFLLKRGEYERIQHLAAQIDSTGAKLELLLKNLLNWNFLQSEQLVTLRAATDVVNLIEELLIVYRELASYKGIKILFEHKVNSIANTDAGLVSLIVRNLLDNAVKNAPSDTEIIVSCTTDGQFFRLQLINSITIENVDRIISVVELFNSRRKWEPGTMGMGIGLKMIKLAVQKLDGKAKVEVSRSKIIWTVVLK